MPPLVTSTAVLARKHHITLSPRMTAAGPGGPKLEAAAPESPGAVQRRGGSRAAQRGTDDMESGPEVGRRGPGTKGGRRPPLRGQAEAACGWRWSHPEFRLGLGARGVLF